MAVLQDRDSRARDNQGRHEGELLWFMSEGPSPPTCFEEAAGDWVAVSDVT